MAPSLTTSLTLAAVVAASSTTVLVDAHQYVILPKPTFTVKTRAEQFNPLAFLENQSFKTTADFEAYYRAKGYKTLRAFMDDKKAYKVDAAGANFECGWTKLNGERQPIPTNGQFRSTGNTHDGPCEVWLDNTRVLKGSNCHTEFPGTTFKVDYSSCKGSCTLRWYWMGIRFLKNKYSWQVYKNCVPLGTASRSIDSDDTVGAEYNDDDEYATSNSTTAATPSPAPKATLAVESRIPSTAGCKTKDNKKAAAATPVPSATIATSEDDDY